MAGYQTPWNQTAMYQMAMNTGGQFNPLRPNETHFQRWQRERENAMKARAAEQRANQQAAFGAATYENQTPFEKWKAARDFESGPTRRVPNPGPYAIGYRDVPQRDVSRGDPETGGYGGQGPGGFNEWSANRDDYRRAVAAGDFENMSPSQREEARMDMSAFRYKQNEEMIAAKQKKLADDQAAEQERASNRQPAYDEASAPSGPSDASALSPTPRGRVSTGPWSREGNSNYAPPWWNEYEMSGHDAPITDPWTPPGIPLDVQREMEQIRKGSQPDKFDRTQPYAELYKEFGGDPKNRITDRADDGSADNFEGAYAADSGGHDSASEDDIEPGDWRDNRGLSEQGRLEPTPRNIADPQAPDLNLAGEREVKSMADAEAYREKIGTATDKVKAAGDAGHLPPDVVAGMISQLRSGRPSAFTDVMWRLNELGIREGWIDPPPLHEDSLQRRR